MREQLDVLVASGLATGYTVEEDARYLAAQAPTLTYRMYSEGAASHFNLGEFVAAMAGLGADMRISRVEGVLGDRRHLRRSRQLCVTAEFPTQAAVHAAAGLVRRRFTASLAAAPGSWQLPDVRITGAEPSGTAAAFAHHWRVDAGCAVVLTLDPRPPLAGACTNRVRILESWVGFLGGTRLLAVSA